ncbi:hypothetical protein MTO98_17300 [Mucilaginibacter sp. SMC90]|uniref:hypothetical protein n=1 Tax=Mucilaginibacter sp. SMC90 TaxID=2929803 RepID=UPI001FB48E33|nr:hypothetical protein [Mucilaginibacter sp. SMC90]UOE52827.1 hypothetical protein MTO98_17300 [Mucilaginibacter sp. SMC90]
MLNQLTAGIELITNPSLKRRLTIEIINECLRSGTHQTESDWLEIRYGANHENQWRLGAFLMNLKNPSTILSRTDDHINVPTKA